MNDCDCEACLRARSPKPLNGSHVDVSYLLGQGMAKLDAITGVLLRIEGRLSPSPASMWPLSARETALLALIAGSSLLGIAEPQEAKALFLKLISGG